MMGENIKKVAIFVAGLAIGGVSTYFATKSKYTEIMNEEIDMVRDYYSGLLKGEVDIDEDEDEESEPTVAEEAVSEVKPNIREVYKQKVEECGYSYDEEDEDEDDEEESKTTYDAPYVIPPEDLGEYEDYEVIELMYYEEDGILADDCDEIVDDVEGTVGWAALKSFGEYEDDAVHVRNDMRRCDYEILRNDGAYRDVVHDYQEE